MHSTRRVYLTWLFNSCMSDTPGNDGIIGSVPLEIRVGLIIKTEDISLVNQAFAMSGTRQSSC